jgi:hypothetical protein
LVAICLVYTNNDPATSFLEDSAKKVHSFVSLLFSTGLSFLLNDTIRGMLYVSLSRLMSQAGKPDVLVGGSSAELGYRNKLAFKLNRQIRRSLVRSCIFFAALASVNLVLTGGTVHVQADDATTKEETSFEPIAKLRGMDPEGFKPVFNGKDFTGWKGPVENYEVKDDAIVCKKGKGGTIFTEEEFGNFIVRLEFKLPAGGNNGLAIRYPAKGNPAYAGMCELQVLDSEHPKYSRLDKRQYHGSAYGMAAAKRGFLRPEGEWNYQQVTVKGPTIKVELNGHVILDTDLSAVTEYMANSPHPGKDLKRGHFGFAGHSDPVQFRAISIKSLD